MKNKKILALLAMTITLSCVMTACSFGGDDGQEQVIVEEEPTPEPTEEPEPTPTIAPDAQSTIYTSSDKSISIEVPDATWANKTDETDMVSFESPEQGKILITHGEGEEDMSSAIIPSTEDMANTLEKASDLEMAVDFEIRTYTAEAVEGANIYNYLVHYMNTEKTDGVVYRIYKVIANDNEFYNIEASVKQDDEALLAKVQESVDSFQILGDSTLKNATPGNSTDEASEAENTDGSSEKQSSSGEGVVNGGFSDEALTDTNQTRTIYRNSDGKPLVITPDGNGNWVDNAGNTYRFVNDEDVYDQNDVDYYYHGEAADVYYMPIDGE
jgi:hypothetical protein